jgi:hypothetical protein
MEFADVLTDPDLGSVLFTVEHITFTRGREGTASRSRTETARGCVHPGTPEMLRLLPEEEKREEFIAVYTDCPLSTGAPEASGAAWTGADRIHWREKTWRVVRVRDWSLFGYYQALAVRMEESP